MHGNMGSIGGRRSFAFEIPFFPHIPALLVFLSCYDGSRLSVHVGSE